MPIDTPLEPTGEASLRAALNATARRALAARSDAAGSAQLARHVAALIATGAWIGLQLPVWPLVMGAHGILLVFLFYAHFNAGYASRLVPGGAR